MSNLLVRDLDPELISELKRRAGVHGRSAEAEHREILRDALSRPQKKSFEDHLLDMPNVGLDSDFERGENIVLDPYEELLTDSKDSNNNENVA